jgi:hypothetical protein
VGHDIRLAFLSIEKMIDHRHHRANIILRRCILITLYDLFQEHPLAEIELAHLETACQTTVKALNWNLAYLEKKGLVELRPAVECLPYVACTVTISGQGIDLVENEAAFDRRFPFI